ncbi:MAG: tetratricopeptide repeat protein [Chitinivibrionales bacterium]|nr:tetratricopeptide repeat protein [Chitinivibrionales bacterium]
MGFGFGDHMDEWLDVTEVVHRADDLIDMGLFDEAARLVERYAEIYRDHWEIPYIYSRICNETGKHAQAVRYLHYSIKLGGHNVDCYLGLFYAYTQIGRMRRGARYLFRARSKAPNNSDVLSALIWYYGETNRFKLGLGVFSHARELGIDNPDIYRNAGLIYQRLGDYAGAGDCFRRALELAPLSDELHDLLADLYILMGQADKAIALYEELLEKSENNVHALSRLVFCLAQHGDTAKAEEIARRTTKLYPNSPVGYVDLAYVHLNAADFTSALEQVERALSVAPLEAEAYRVKGIVLSEQEHDQEAEEAFLSALSLDKDNPEIMRDYYHHLRKVGDFRKMEQVVRSVIQKEKPYCVEDYWFLADHYWEEGKSLKAFQCLNRAHKSMPGERELLPPLITIMLDRGHISYAMPYLLGYVDRAGWDDAMKSFARHRSLQSHYARESLRFLRFHAERALRYRNRAFMHYLRRWLAYMPWVLLPPVGYLLYVLRGTSGILAAVGGCIVLFGLARLWTFFAEAPPLAFRRLFHGTR